MGAERQRHIDLYPFRNESLGKLQTGIETLVPESDFTQASRFFSDLHGEIDRLFSAKMSDSSYELYEMSEGIGAQQWKLERAVEEGDEQEVARLRLEIDSDVENFLDWAVELADGLRWEMITR